MFMNMPSLGQKRLGTPTLIHIHTYKHSQKLTHTREHTPLAGLRAACDGTPGPQTHCKTSRPPPLAAQTNSGKGTWNKQQNVGPIKTGYYVSLCPVKDNIMTQTEEGRGWKQSVEGIALLRNTCLNTFHSPICFGLFLAFGHNPDVYFRYHKQNLNRLVYHYFLK